MLSVWTNHEDWIVADGFEAVRVYWCENISSAEDFDPSDWEELAPGFVLVVHNDDGEPPERKTCAEWCEQGPGHLGSVNT